MRVFDSCFFMYVILISQTWLDLPAEQRLADRDLQMAGCWRAAVAAAVVDALHLWRTAVELLLQRRWERSPNLCLRPRTPLRGALPLRSIAGGSASAERVGQTPTA